MASKELPPLLNLRQAARAINSSESTIIREAAKLRKPIETINKKIPKEEIPRLRRKIRYELEKIRSKTASHKRRPVL